MRNKRLLATAALPLVIVLLILGIGYIRKPKLERAGAIETLLPSVVRITTHSLVKDDAPEAKPGAMKVQESFGSGFIVDRNGYIVTNRHVIKDAYEIMVRLDDGEPVRAKLIGHGNNVDLALLKIDTNKKLTPVKFGRSEDLQLGDDVIVIGNPFGLGTTVTSGIISALNRDLGFSMFDSFIQTDAPINHGNSGGPLFNMKGQVVGVNTAYYTGGNAKGGSIGLGFAIPAETTQEVVGLLRKYGYLKLGWVGIDGASITPEMVNALGLSIKTGAIVADVVKGSPADGELKRGDVIYQIDGDDLEDMRMLRRDVAASLGKKVRLKILRGERSETVYLTPVEWPGGQIVDAKPQQPLTDRGGVASDLGFASAPITPDIRARFEIDPGQNGAVVTSVEPRSAAADSGLEIGDVVQTVQLEPVAAPADIAARVVETIKKKRDYITLFIRSHGKSKYISLPVKWEAPPQVAQSGG
ncbi:MAG: trypsin-like peptidase domain-containing protein [Hyphomicrobiales bacterium]|nr:trypsin-like peptidase domain-containing protein [Hyphomicrobiales bacterium]